MFKRGRGNGLQIKEVETLVGITQKNIRFYEKEGLLTPNRQTGNGYRQYSDADVACLQRIKLLRKLDVPLGEIARMQQGEQPFSKAMKHHLTLLEQRQKNLEHSMSIAEELTLEPGFLQQVDAKSYLSRMETMERQGVHFVNVEKNDKQRRYRGAWLGAGLFIGLMLLMEALLVWAVIYDPPPIGIAVVFLTIPVLLLVCVLVALIQRLQEIEKGEIDDYRNY